MSILLRNNKILATPTTPLNLVNLKLWLSAGRMYQYSDGTAIPNFIDYSGNNFHATNNTVTEQPLFKKNSFASQSSLKFDGLNDKLNINALNIFQNINEYTVQIAAKRSVISTNSEIFNILNNANTGVRLGVSFLSNGNIQFASKKSDTDPTLINQFPSNDLNVHYIQLTLNPANYTIYFYIDGNSVGSQQLSSSGNLDNTTSANINVGWYQVTNSFGSSSISEISVNQKYSNPSTITQQYQGFLIRSGYLANSPLSLSNLKLYLSATRMAQQADESLVPIFKDFSGNNYHAVQANINLQPKFDLNQFGLNAGIRINGGKYLESSILVLSNTNQFTVQMVAKRNFINTSAYPISFSDANNTDSLFGFGWAAAGYGICYGKRLTSDIRTDIQFTSNDLNVHFIQATLNPTDAKVYVYFDGLLKGAFQYTPGNIETPLKCSIGSTYLLTGSEVNINGISINHSYSDPSIITQQYNGYLNRGYL